MFDSLYYLLSTSNPNLFFTKWVLIFAILIVIVILYRELNPKKELTEGFHQLEPFVSKRNLDAQDTFYAEIYDALHDVKTRNDRELIHMIQTTNPSVNHSVFLDVGSRTGNTVNELTLEGYQTYGIEQSNDMIEYSKELYPNIEVLKGNGLDPMMFEKKTFTHILCNYFNIYSIQDKKRFFQNCYHWMKSGGYLIVHLVDKTKFERIVPHNEAIANKIQVSLTACKINNKIIFEDYEYKGCFEITEKSNNTTFIETMTDLNTKHVRQNETNLYMEDLETIVNMAVSAGFINHAKTNMINMNGDENQYLYYFERPL